MPKTQAMGTETSLPAPVAMMSWWGGAGDDLLGGGGTMTMHIASSVYATNSGLGEAFRFGGVQSQLV